MAYIDKEKVAEVRKTLRKLYPKKDYKFSVTRENYSRINVVIIKSPVVISKEREGFGYSKHSRRDKSEPDTRLAKQILEVIEIICGENVDRNAGDMGADYANYDYFESVTFGAWNKSYEQCKGEEFIIPENEILKLKFKARTVGC